MTEEKILQGYIARDKNGKLILGRRKPTREYRTDSWWGYGQCMVLLDAGLFPDITWENEPVEVEIKLSIKNKELC